MRAMQWTPFGAIAGIVRSTRASLWLGLFLLALLRRWVLRGLAIAASAFAVIALVGNFVFSTVRDAAHRNGHPLSPDCAATPPEGWSILADTAIGNDEGNAAHRDPVWERRLRCTVQTHAVPAADGLSQPLKFHLAFLEYGENGHPLPLDTQSLDRQALARAGAAAPRPSQLDAVIEHLRARPSNHVVAFVHGWRHDASLGDGNVSDLRVYAAHAARFIADRKEKEQRFADMEVTAIYVGWPGARVDERRMVRLFGGIGLPGLGATFATLSAGITLFDRKPVSEAVGPGALSALREIDHVLDAMRRRAPQTEQRMIVFGHSLGGNMLLTALKDHMIKHVRLHQPGATLTPNLGDAVILINPASEAANWTAIQREVWRRIPMRLEDGDIADLVNGHRFFPVDQKPVLMSVTAARNWPPGGVRPSDCAAAQQNQDLRRVLRSGRSLAVRGVEYDAPTHDMFPAFRFDFRPVADSVTQWALRVGYEDDGDSCTPLTPRPFWRHVVKPVFWVAGVLRYFPFMNTDLEQTRTVGHLEALRPTQGTLLQRPSSERPFGTTHELIGLHPPRSEATIDYRLIASHPKAACPPAHGWLLRARRREPPHGSLWDSTRLEPLPQNGAAADGPRPLTGFNPPAAQFVHGFVNTGRAAITRANDPFWNMRAYDNALARHDGYMLSSFICAMQQFVLDDITARLPADPPAPVDGATPLPVQQ
jgi:hypothetical protein